MAEIQEKQWKYKNLVNPEFRIDTPRSHLRILAILGTMADVKVKIQENILQSK